MNRLNIFFVLLISLVALTACKDDDDPKINLSDVEGSWQTTVAGEGIAEDWSTGEMEEYDHFAYTIYMNDDGEGILTVAYLSYGEVLSVDRYEFTYTIDGHGNIHFDMKDPNTPEITYLRYMDGKVYAEINGETVMLERYYPNALGGDPYNPDEAERGGHDQGDQYNTGISDDPATQPSRVKQK